MVYYIGFLSFLVYAIIYHRKLFRKQQEVLCVYLLSIVYICLHFLNMCGYILFQIEFNNNILSTLTKILPVIIVFLISISLKRKK